MLIMNELTNEGTLNQVSFFFFSLHRFKITAPNFMICLLPPLLPPMFLSCLSDLESVLWGTKTWGQDVSRGIKDVYAEIWDFSFFHISSQKMDCQWKNIDFFCSLRLLPKSSHNQKSVSCLAPQAPTLCHWNHVYARFCLSHTQQQVISLISSSPLTEGVLISDIKCSSVCCCRCTAFYTSKQSSSHFWSPD